VEKKPLNKTVKTFYGVGDLGFSLMTSVEIYLFVFFLTNVAKFSLPMVVLIGLITSITDAVLSPFYGAIISGTKALKWGRNRSWMLISPPIVVVLFMFQFTKIGNDVVAATFICAGFILSHIMWNIAWVGNVSLIPIMANNPEERGLLASRRATWTSLSGVFFSYIGAPLALLLGVVTGNAVLGYTLLAGLMALSMVAGYWIVFAITDGYEPIEAETQVVHAGEIKSQKVPISIMLKSIFQNVPLVMLLLGDFFRYMTNFTMIAAAAYYFTYVAQNMKLFPIYLLLGAIAQVIGSFLSASMSKSLSNRTATIVGLFGLAASLILCKFIGLNVTMFFIVVMFARFFLGILTAVMVALYADVVVYGEWKTGKNATSFIMGLMNLSLKTAVISRSTVIPIVLAAAGFVAGANPATASLALKIAVINVFLFIPGIFALVAAIVITLGYRLTREKLVTYQSEIDKTKTQIV